MFVIGFLLTLQLISQPSNAVEEIQQTFIKENELEVFIRDDCPHCAKAKKFLLRFGSERPWLRIVYRSVDHDVSAREDLMKYSQKAGVWPPGVPAFHFKGQLLVGFDNADHIGALLESLVDQTTTDREAKLNQIETALFGTISVSQLGLPLFTLIIGLLDGLNPCAMWVLLFLLSMLVHLQDRKRMALIASIFVLASGIVYYAFMAAWLNVFLLIGLSTVVRWILGGMALTIGGLNVKDFFFWKWGFSLSIPDSAKPVLYARMRAILATDRMLSVLIAVAVLAVLVNFIELLCTAGFPAIYTAILTQQDLNPITYHAYLGLYILGYLADDALMVGASVIALSSHKLTLQTGRLLKLVSGLLMLGLGGILILRPEWLV
ncbi:glutaredoxin domain-containing protein [Nitrosomonas communis]|uniref:Glutaredoxin n=1 Tax=Nitrosomonas communis TaxID=44574 RepID=A0A1I4PVK9_9PROT|nr:glutaredoxin domain-containing protein [Nitrosomonas communis]SFM31861.1 Glutaredoxin [Nitrosomonas communis]